MLISHKLYLGFGTVLATLGVVAAATWIGTNRTQSELNDLSRESKQAK
jgi:hypothetical protein